MRTLVDACCFATVVADLEIVFLCAMFHGVARHGFEHDEYLR